MHFTRSLRRTSWCHYVQNGFRGTWSVNKGQVCLCALNEKKIEKPRLCELCHSSARWRHGSCARFRSTAAEPEVPHLTFTGGIHREHPHAQPCVAAWPLRRRPPRLPSRRTLAEGGAVWTVALKVKTGQSPTAARGSGLCKVNQQNHYGLQWVLLEQVGITQCFWKMQTTDGNKRKMAMTQSASNNYSFIYFQRKNINWPSTVYSQRNGHLSKAATRKDRHILSHLKLFGDIKHNRLLSHFCWQAISPM